MSFKRILTTTIAITLFSPNLPLVLSEPISWDSHPDGYYHSYEIIPSFQITWTEAKADAEAKGGYLVTVTSQQETDFIVTNLGGQAIQTCWLGAYQDSDDPGFSEPGGGWKWVTGESWDYTLWNPSSGEPNNVILSPYGAEDCANFHGDNPQIIGSWADVADTNTGATFGYVFESTGQQVPEPTATIGLLSMVLVGLGGYAWRRRRIR